MLPSQINPKKLPKRIAKFYHRRFDLFSKYDEDVRIDEVGWFSVTPEAIAIHTANKAACNIILDLFVGVGGNAIQFAKTCNTVWAVDNDLTRLLCAQHNAQIYDCNNIQYFHQDAFEFLKNLQERPDCIYLSPPWGGPEYLKLPFYTLEMIPLDFKKLLKLCSKVCDCIIMYLPRTLTRESLESLMDFFDEIEIEEVYSHDSLRALQIYGNLT